MQFAKKIYYIFREIDLPITFKIKYFSESLIKFPVLLLNKYLNLKLPLPYLFNKDYILKNKRGIWKIRHHSDFDYTINSYHELEIEQHFKFSQGIFLDIGAHIGKWSIFVAKSSPEIVVYSFEPNPIVFKYLQENIKLNQLKNIIPINLGVSSKKEKLCFYMPETMTSTAKIVSCSTNKDVIEIETTSIDEFIHKTKINPLKITLIKIDVEGHEFEVLKGMKKLLKMLPNDIKIICEILEDKNINLILKFMKKLGYIHKVLETQTDYLFYKFP